MARASRWTRWRGRLFVDSTGDGWIGHFAGARTMYGREAGSAFGEEWIAPKVADRLTMSGTLTTANKVVICAGGQTICAGKLMLSDGILYAGKTSTVIVIR